MNFIQMEHFNQMIKKSTLILVCFFCFLSSCNSEDEYKMLPEININFDSNNINIGDYIEASFSYQNKKRSISIENFPIKIKYRGNASSHHPKKNFSLKLSEKVCFIKSKCHKRWKLNAAYTDKTFMRNKLSYDIFKLLSTNNIAPRISYVTLNINHNYNGIYSLTERVDSDLLNFIKNDTNAVLFKDAPISYPPEEHEQRHIDFIAYSEWAEFYKEFSDKSMHKLIKRVYYNQRFPQINVSNKKYLIHKLTTFIFNSSDAEFKNKELFNTHFDLNNIIDWHLLLLLTNNGDGLVKNFYLYRQGTNKPFKICPWDYDHSFGRDGGGELNLDEFISLKKIALLDRLLSTNAFNYREKLLHKFLSLKKTKILTASNIHKMIDDNATILEPFVQENEDKWPLDSIQFFNKKSNFFSEITLIKIWIEKRLPKVEDYLKEIQLTSELNR